MKRRLSDGGSPPWWRSGVALMAGAAALSKLIGTLQKIPLQNLAGDRVFGLYNAVYPLYQLIAALATAGIPVAISIVVARRVRAGDAGKQLRILLLVAVAGLSALGALACIAMWAGSERLASLIGDRAAAPAVRALALAMLLAPAAAALRGYAQGLGRMEWSAASSVSEQSMRVMVMLAALALGLSAGWEASALTAGVMAGAVAASGTAVIVLVACLLRQERSRPAVGGALSFGERGGGTRIAPIDWRELLREMKGLATAAVPAALAAIIAPALGLVDAFTVPGLLQRSLTGEADAMALFGVYGRGQPLVQLVVMVAGAAAAALVPGVASQQRAMPSGPSRERLSLVVRLSWLGGAAAASGLVMLANPLNTMLYADAKGTAAFALVGCTALAGSVLAVAAPLLLALGQTVLPAALVLLAALLKGALNVALVPSLGIEGAALSGVVALGVAALLAGAALYRASGGAWRAGHRAATIRPVAAAALALACMAAALWLLQRGLGPALEHGLPHRAAAAVVALTGVAVGAAVFAAAALRGGAIDARHWRALPGGEALAARLRRLRLAPPLPPRDGAE